VLQKKAWRTAHAIVQNFAPVRKHGLFFLVPGHVPPQFFKKPTHDLESLPIFFQRPLKGKGRGFRRQVVAGGPETARDHDQIALAAEVQKRFTDGPKIIADTDSLVQKKTSGGEHFGHALGVAVDDIAVQQFAADG
jgi:hypothetical protein